VKTCLIADENDVVHHLLIDENILRDDFVATLSAHVRFEEGAVWIEVEGYGDVACVSMYERAPEVIAWPQGPGGEDGENVTTRIRGCKSLEEEENE
jgi:hypothetical protein